MRKILIRVFVATAALFLCALIGFYLIPQPWEGRGGRDFSPQATNTAVLIAIVAFVLRLYFKWEATELIIGLLPFEGILLFVISYFSGANFWERFAIEWLLGLNLYVALPWLVGSVLASLLLLWRRKD